MKLKIGRTFVLALLASSGVFADANASADANATSDANDKPAIGATAPGSSSYRRDEGDHKHLISTYGDDITIFCTARDAAKLAIENVNRLLKPVLINSTTIQVSIEKPDVGEYTYDCSSTAYKQSLVVTVRPAIVVSSNVRLTSGSYYVTRDEIYNVFCSANNVENLSLETYNEEYDYYVVIKAEAVNGTTVFATLTNNLDVRRYKCQKAGIFTAFDVIVDYSPEIREFQCVLHLFQKLQCSWTSSNTKNTFTLSSGNQLVCTDMSRAAACGCTRGWDKWLDDIYAFSPLSTHLPLQLEICNEKRCNNQTFSIEIRSIIKIEPVRNLIIKLSKPRDKALRFENHIYEIEWLHRNLLCYRGCEYKIEYRVAGMHWRQAKITEVTGYDFSGGVINTFKLPLPCPETLYEIRVYVRAKTVSEERLWAEPASVKYITFPREMSPRDLSCAEFRKQGPFGNS